MKRLFYQHKTYIDINDNSDLTLGYNYFKSKNTSSGYLTKAQAQSNPTQKVRVIISHKSIALNFFGLSLLF